MSETSSGLLRGWVGGLRSVKMEVAPVAYPEVTSVKKTRNIKPKGVDQLRRISRREAKEEKIVEEIVETESRTLMYLLNTGGSGGHQRLEIPDKVRWNSFQRENNVTTTTVPTTAQREKHNENAFASVNDMVEIDDDTAEIDDNTNRGTHRICNLNKIEACLNENSYCNCHIHDFIE